MNEFDKSAVDTVRIRQFDAHRKAIADTLRLPLDSDLVEEVAFLRTLREAERARFMGGKTIDVSAYLTLSKVLNEITPAKPHRFVTIEFSDRGGPEKTPSSDALVDTIATSAGGDDTVSSEAVSPDDIEFKKQFGPTAHRGVPNPPKPTATLSVIVASHLMSLSGVKRT